MKLVAHRACAAGDAENTIESLAGLASWVDGVEIDVRQTADGVCILMHDSTVDRTTDGTGRVADLEGHQISRLRTGAASVPTLANYLEAVSRSELELVLIDIKDDDTSLRRRVASIVHSATAAPRCVAMVRTPDAAEHLRAEHPGLRLGFLGVTVDNAERRFAEARQLQVELLLVRYGDESYLHNRSVIALAQEQGLYAGASTINAESALRAAYDDDCDVVLSDRTAELDPAWWAVA